MVGKSGETSATRNPRHDGPSDSKFPAEKAEKAMGMSKPDQKGLEHTFDSTAKIRNQMDRNVEYQKELQKKILVLKGHQLVSTHVYEFPDQDPGTEDLRKRRAFS
mmetsp:Transcript_16702/g.25756  ORF Transcript_16702/g.25756 Transcript_16702/m.25756 type:complete len:105 (-) Transcript_16702:216-530(-)